VQQVANEQPESARWRVPVVHTSTRSIGDIEDIEIKAQQEIYFQLTND